MIAAANRHAAEAGLEILQAGGSAIDAAIAAQMVLGLVEPQSSGIGGGGFLLHYNATSGAIESFDGRETAPASATGDLFRKADGSLMSWPEAASGGLSVGVPGLLRMLELAHRKHGRLPWARLFDRAIQLAENGFIVSPRMAGSIAGNGDLARFLDNLLRYPVDAILEQLRCIAPVRHLPLAVLDHREQLLEDTWTAVRPLKVG